MSFTLSKADRKQHNDFWNSNQTDTILRLQNILTVVSNVTLMTPTLVVKFSDTAIFMWAPKHKRMQSTTCWASLETSHMQTDRTDMQELLLYVRVTYKTC